MKKIIHVNRSFIGFNTKYGKSVLPCYIVREGSKPSIYGFSVDIKGPCQLIDSREKSQLNCGARAWMETDSEVIIVDAMNFQEANDLRKKYQLELDMKS